MKVASIIDVKNEQQFREWVRTLPITIPEKRLEILVERAMLKGIKKAMWQDKGKYPFTFW